MGGRNHNLQFSTKPLNSRHLILHPSLGLGPLHVLAKFKITAPGEEQWQVGLKMWNWGEGEEEREIQNERDTEIEKEVVIHPRSKSNDHNHANSVMF